ncbi:minor capsid protein [Heyndrickxia oleronia]|jgi:SPP1 gp7 family putative phage head morphogenesis protein|uniref:minor capsid protein n=1 Tax=Heyndrickxia oleronia TaxID=38875 RepID=UPI00243112E0|nr:minor capsid protein [Heyndrickxia oleronia]MCI1590381.1 minor capsid protein [Heyndrickxia oleronia]MCI1611357.1 minor capsid protein [Heyndrickxia oleronia]MCI1742800.1 minor capsid protein [Heyndrickxia oleronia]MCI1763115.1 minor capsid protein [Heyndrickxia oleronia]
MNEFEKSLLKIIKEMYDLSDKEFRQVLMKYKTSRDNIIQFIAQLYILHSEDGILDYVYLDRIGAIKLFDNKVEEELKGVGVFEVSILTSILGIISQQVYNKSAYQIEKYVKLNSPKQLGQISINKIIAFNWSGIPYSNRIKMNQQALRNSLKTTFVRSIQDGDSIDKVANKFKANFNSNAHQSNRLLLTETARVIDQTQEKLYRQNKFTQVEWVSALEQNTCMDCANLDGSVFNLDDLFRPRIPRHPNCKCTYLPYMDI